MIDDIKRTIVTAETRMEDAQDAITILKASGEDVSERQRDLDALKVRIKGLKTGLKLVTGEG